MKITKIVILFCLACSAANVGSLSNEAEYDCYSASESQEKTVTKHEPKRNNVTCLTPDCVVSAGSILSIMNPAADPCDDFYNYACGSYELLNSIPAGQSLFSPGNAVSRSIALNVRTLLEEPQNLEKISAARLKAKLYYKSCMDIGAIANNSLLWFRKAVVKMGGFRLQGGTDQVPRNWNLNTLLKKRNRLSLNGPFSASVGQDDKNVLTNIIQLVQGGLGLGDDTRDYYLGRDVTKDPILVAYTDLLQFYAETALGPGVVDRKLIVEIVEFEKKLATIHRTQSEQMLVAEIYFKTNIKWLQKKCDFIDWLGFFNDLFRTVTITLTSDEPILIYNAPYFEDLTALMNEYLASENGKRTLQNYFTFLAISPYLTTLGGQFQEARDRFLSIFSGKKGSLDRWQICTGQAGTSVGFGLGAMYVDKFFPPDHKTQIKNIVIDLIDSFRNRIRQALWMDDETRSKAIEKVKTLTYDVAYPDWVQNDTYLDIYYEGLRLTDDFVTNQVSSYQDGTRRMLRDARLPPDPLRWYMTPHTVNAYYDPTKNKIAILAGILNRPFFYPAKDIPMALNYGAIGSIIGHEISHGFDSNGREYDKLGNLFNWWSNETRQQFDDRAECFVKKFDSYEYKGLQLRGEQTLGENIADDAGIKASYAAFAKARRDARTGPVNQLVGVDLTDDQLFFVGFAQQWCAVYTDQMVRLMILQDAHTIFPFRIAGPLSDSPDFARVFNCPIGSKMNPVKKCSVW